MSRRCTIANTLANGYRTAVFAAPGGVRRSTSQPRDHKLKRTGRVRLAQILDLLGRIVGVVFMRVNSKCAHQVHPPLPPGYSGARSSGKPLADYTRRSWLAGPTDDTTVSVVADGGRVRLGDDQRGQRRLLLANDSK